MSQTNEYYLCAEEIRKNIDEYNETLAPMEGNKQLRNEEKIQTFVNKHSADMDKLGEYRTTFMRSFIKHYGGDVKYGEDFNHYALLYLNGRTTLLAAKKMLEG
jgi:hypothetical protein